MIYVALEKKKEQPLQTGNGKRQHVKMENGKQETGERETGSGTERMEENKTVLRKALV